MKAIQIELDKSQVIKIFNQLDEKDKLELFYKLKKSLFLKRFNKLLESTRTDELTMDEIINEVESVRKERYEKGKQLL
jgi:Mg/Co/Ni transporter MgtE